MFKRRAFFFFAGNTTYTPHTYINVPMWILQTTSFVKINNDDDDDDDDDDGAPIKSKAKPRRRKQKPNRFICGA